MLRKARLQAKYLKTRDKALLPLIKVITDEQLDLIKPKNLDPQDKNNFIAKIELSFEGLCTALEEMGISRPKDLTVFEFYAKIRYFETKKKPSTLRRNNR